MNKDDKKIARITTVVVSALVLVIIAVLLIGGSKSYNNGIVVENIVDNWDCIVDGKKLDKKVSLNHKFQDLNIGSKVIFIKKSKEIEEIAYPLLVCDFMFCSAEVFYNDELVHTHRYNKGISAKTEATIQLENYKNDNEIRIELKIVSPTRKIFMSEAKIIEEIELIGYRLRHNMYSLILAGVLILFGSIVLIITVCLESKSPDVRKLFWIGLFSSTLALFLAAKKNFILYVFGEQVVTEVILTLAIVIAIPSIFRIHILMYKDDKIRKTFEKFFAILVIIIGVFLIFEDTLEKYVNTIVLIGVTFIILMGGLIELLVKDIKNVKGMNKFFDVGIFIIYGTILIMLIILIFCDYIYFIEVFDIGIMFIGAVQLVFVMIYYSYKIKDYMDKLSEDKVLETLAFIDPLTGIMNRTKYEEELKIIRENKFLICSVVSFDLNCLKEINDLNGHEAGDEYIKAFSEALKVGFGEEGFIARIGGDEFIAIIKNKYVDIEGKVIIMQSLLKTAMNKYKDVEISFAYGSSISRKGQNKSIDELIESSDKKMYRNKKKIKERHKTN